MIVDTHCHYNLEPLQSDWRTHWHNAKTHGVTNSIIIGVDVGSSQLAIEMATTEPAFKVAVGLHPSNFQTVVENSPDFSFEESVFGVNQEIDQLKNIVASPAVIAIGETGLDYFRLPSDPNLQLKIKKLQQHAFIQQILLANEYDLTLVVHVRDITVAEGMLEGNAYWDTLRLLRQYHEGKKPFILHCASGPIAYIHQAVEMGAFFGIAGNVTYKNADRIRDIVRVVPVDQLLSETDAPYLPPQEFRGQASEPWMIAKTMMFLKEEMEIDPEHLAYNAQKLLSFG